jgi:hypothetical protein
VQGRLAAGARDFEQSLLGHLVTMVSGPRTGGERAVHGG